MNMVINGPYHYAQTLTPVSPPPSEIFIDSLVVEPSTSVLGDELNATIVIRNIGGFQTNDWFWLDFYENQALALLPGPVVSQYVQIDSGFLPRAYEIVIFDFEPDEAVKKKAWVQADKTDRVSGPYLKEAVVYS